MPGGARLALPPGVIMGRVPRVTLGLRTRLVGLLVGCIALLAAALWIVLPGRLDQLSTRWSESRSLGIARLLGRLAAVPLDFDDAEAAALILDDLRTAGGVRYAVLSRPDGSPLATWGQVPDGWPRAGGAEQVGTRGGLLHAAVPVTTRSGGRGGLTVGFDLAELEERRAEARRMVALVAALLLGLAIPLAVTIGAMVIAPLRRVTGVARRIAAGEASARALLPTSRSDEVGALAVAFDVMLDRLYRQEEDVRRLNAELEGRVAMRTAELEVANREIAHRLEELTRTQAQLVTADRRITIGRLAAGVAHEINNPLAYVDGNLAYLGDELRALRAAVAEGPAGAGEALRSFDEMAAAVEDSRHGAARVRHIVRGLKTYARAEGDATGPVSPRAALDGALDMARHEVGRRAQLVTRLGPLPQVLGHEVRLSQVFLNLLVNAAQAIPEGAADANEVRVTAFTDGEGRAVVEVSDTGAGIPPEVRARLFEPFFTTKPQGEGTGLGLSISRGLVEGSGGRIEVESAVGRGSTFRVVLPPAPAAPAAATPVAAAAASARTRLRLLVVDDEALVARAIQRGLAREHDVVVESAARSALERLAGDDRWDAILCDLQMPEMTGQAFREALADRSPAVAAKVIFMTGGAMSEAAQRLLDDPGTTWVQKPIDFEQLRRILHERTA